MTAATYPGPETIHRHVLDNGITVLIYENMLSNTVAIEGVVRAGAVVEPAMQAGLADFTADLLIRGSIAFGLVLVIAGAVLFLVRS